MIITKNAQREILLVAGERLREVLNAVAKQVTPGTTTEELNRYAHTLVTENGDEPSFLGYKPSGASKGYPATLCVSINDEVVHGIPKKGTVIKEGDIVSIDCGLRHKEIFVDAACTVIAGNTDNDTKAKELLEATKKALRYALVFVRAGAKTGDIGNAIETVANEYGFVTPPEIGGHGIGIAQHEEPFIPNMGDPGTGESLQEGQVISIEPIFFEGINPRITVTDDGFTYRTADGSRAAHFEHTVIVNKSTPTVATGPMW